MAATPDATILTPRTPAETVSLIRAQDALYRELESLATRQRFLVSAEDTGSLFAVLADRQRLAEKLTEIAGRLEPIRRNWAHYRQQLSPPQLAEAETLLTETTTRLQRVIERDEHDARILSARKQAVAKALCAGDATNRAIAAYRDPPTGRTCLDRLDEEPS